MESKWYERLLALLKLETTSSHGRINLGGVLIITMFCLVYSASDVVRHIISATEDVIKSIALETDIYHEYESPSVIGAVLPIVFAFVLCLAFLIWHEKRKNK